MKLKSNVKGLGSTKNWLRYWRNSLADSECGKGALSNKDLRSFYQAKVSVFQHGCLVNGSDDNQNEAILKKLFVKKCEKIKLVKTLIRPTIFISKYEHGKKHTSTRPDVVSPIICPVG